MRRLVGHLWFLISDPSQSLSLSCLASEHRPYDTEFNAATMFAIEKSWAVGHLLVKKFEEIFFVLKQCMSVMDGQTDIVKVRWVWCMQAGCALVSHTVASIIWQQFMIAHPASLVAALHCGHPDVTLDTPVTAAAQFLVVLLLGLIAMKSGSVVVDLWEMIGQLIINGIIFATGHSQLSNIVIVITAAGIVSKWLPDYQILSVLLV